MSSRSDQYADEPYREETYRDEDGPHETDEYGYDTDDWDTGEGEGIWRFWDEGIITLLIVGGAILFVFPEPVTSGIGVLMMGFGLLMWLVDWAT